MRPQKAILINDKIITNTHTQDRGTRRSSMQTKKKENETQGDGLGVENRLLI